MVPELGVSHREMLLQLTHGGVHDFASFCGVLYSLAPSLSGLCWNMAHLFPVSEPFVLSVKTKSTGMRNWEEGMLYT